jgi:hypothetical protein
MERPAAIGRWFADNGWSANGPQAMEASVASVSLPSVPYGADETVFVVIENTGGRGSVNRNTELGDLETVVAELLAGQIGDPICVVAFNTLEHWSKDLSADVAREIQTRCDIDGVPVPDHLRDFVEVLRATA